MANIQRSYQNAALRRQIDIRRYTVGEVKRMLTLMRTADAELVEKLRARLAKLGAVTDFTSKRFKALLASIRETRKEILGQLKANVTRDLQKLAVQEAAAETKLLLKSIPVEIGFAAVAPEILRAAVTTQPFEGRLLGEWFGELSRRDQGNLTRAIQLGLSQGEGVDQIVRRVAGTKADNFTVGALADSRRQAEAVVRTGINHVSNVAREEVWSANADIISGLRWVSTLDSRTTIICASRDGKVAPIEDADGNRKPIPEGEEALEPADARPPAHVGCLVGDCLVTPCGSVTAVTKRFYDGQVVVIRTVGNHELTCTPNHPILTERGWVAAHFLNRGDRVVRYLGRQDPFSVVEGEDQKGPTPIEEVAGAVFSLGSVDEVTAARGSFHGDVAEGEVCAVGTNRPLEHVEHQAPLLQHGGEERFEGRPGISSSLTGKSPLAALGQAGATATRSCVGSVRLMSTLGGSHAIPPSLGCRAADEALSRICPSETTSFSVRPLDDAPFRKDSVNDDPGELSVAAEVKNALTGMVSLDEVVEIGRRDFSGHVFNLQTGSGIYFATAGSIVTHNCRSTMLPMLSNVGILDKMTRPAIKEAKKDGESMAEFRSRWTDENVVQVPAKTTYEEFLKDQSEGFQNEVLGKTKADLFRSGKVELEQFVDRQGNELSLDQLEARGLTE